MVMGYIMTIFLKYRAYRFIVISVLICIFADAFAQGFNSIIDLVPATAIKNTGEKPQSKVWTYNGEWWAVFPISTGTYIWRLNGTSWTSTLKISSSTTVKADCKAINNVCHILLIRNANAASQLVSVEYNHASRAYEFWRERVSTILISLDSGAETGTIDIDVTGRMWLASDGINDIRVRWSDPPYAAWSSPIVLATNITDDDICAIIALPIQRQVGVLWSDQNSKRFGFKTHNDGTDSESWSIDEVPASQSALEIGNGMADDHLNISISRDGILFCAVKTSYDAPGYPRLALLKRSPSGTWDNLYEVSQSGTRGIVILNEVIGKLKVVYTSQEDGGDILYRESPTSDISFSAPMTLLKGVYNNSTSSKNNYDSDIVVLASDNDNIVGILGRDPASLTVSIAPRLAESTYCAYPNPVHDFIILEFKAKSDEDISLSLSDSEGRILLRSIRRTKDHLIEIDLRNLLLSPGTYFLATQSGKRSDVFRFEKK